MVTSLVPSRPCFIVSAAEHARFRRVPHEIRASVVLALTGREWSYPLPSGRRVHVREEVLAGGDVAIRAHSETAGGTCERASVRGGSRSLVHVLRALGWTIEGSLRRGRRARWRGVQPAAVWVPASPARVPLACVTSRSCAGSADAGAGGAVPTLVPWRRPLTEAA